MKRRSKHSCAHRSCCESRWHRGWYKPDIYFFPMQNSSLTEIILVSVKDFFIYFYQRTKTGEPVVLAQTEATVLGTRPNMRIKGGVSLAISE